MSRTTLGPKPEAASSTTADASSGWRRRLLDWYDRHRRPLPWRGSRDPYRVWVSEVMLQQTQVATATPFYQSFLVRFPTLATLARARAADVLAAWAGLGYYRRARHLHQAARRVVREHAGQVPDDVVCFGALPGVGRYTTGAVLSICFDRRLAVLDGNVARVLSRFHAVRASVKDPSGARALWALADSLVPMRRPGDWNQALMELGATVCLPRGPRCEACPIRPRCRAYGLGKVAEFPPAAPRRRPERVRRAVAVIKRRGSVLMVRREGRLLDGLWEPPGVELGENGASTPAALGAVLRALGVRARLEPTGQRLRHVITHRVIEVEVWRGTPTAPVPRVSRLRYVDPAAPSVAITAMGKRACTIASSWVGRSAG